MPATALPVCSFPSSTPFLSNRAVIILLRTARITRRLDLFHLPVFPIDMSFFLVLPGFPLPRVVQLLLFDDAGPPRPCLDGLASAGPVVEGKVAGDYGRDDAEEDDNRDGDGRC